MTLREAIDKACELAKAGGFFVIRTRSEVYADYERRIRFSYKPISYGQIMSDVLMVEYRFYPDKHEGWSDWLRFGGFSVDDIQLDDWIVSDDGGTTLFD